MTHEIIRVIFSIECGLFPHEPDHKLYKIDKKRQNGIKGTFIDVSTENTKVYKNPSTEVYPCYTFVKVFKYAFGPLLL